MQLTPLFDRILVRVLDDNTRTAGGLHIPDVALAGTPYKICEVVSAGAGRISDSGVLIPMRVSVGQVILVWRNAQSGDQIVVPHNGEELLLVREAYVVAVVTDLERASSLTSVDGKPLVATS